MAPEKLLLLLVKIEILPTETREVLGGHHKTQVSMFNIKSVLLFFSFLESVVNDLANKIQEA